MAPEATGEMAPEATGEMAPEATGEMAPEATGEMAPEATGEKAPESARGVLGELPGVATVLGAFAVAIKVATPVVLNSIGFTAIGPAAGTTASAWMASMGAQGVAAGSWYAACQSAAMGGGALFGLPVLVGFGAIPAAGYFGVRYFRGNDTSSETISTQMQI